MAAVWDNRHSDNPPSYNNTMVESPVRLKIQRLSLGGEGVGRSDGHVIFVPYAAPGDLLEIEVVETHPRYARGRILQVLEPSAERTEPPCPYFFRCGGCAWQHLTYPAQLKAKQALV